MLRSHDQPNSAYFVWVTPVIVDICILNKIVVADCELRISSQSTETKAYISNMATILADPNTLTKITDCTNILGHIIYTRKCIKAFLSMSWLTKQRGVEERFQTH